MSIIKQLTQKIKVSLNIIIFLEDIKITTASSTVTNSGILVNTPSMKNIKKVLDLDSCEKEEIDEIIKNNKETKKVYSKTYAENNYTPLSNIQKMKFLEDLTDHSDKRLKLYSELFKEIKCHISTISNNISTTILNNSNDISQNTIHDTTGNITSQNLNRSNNKANKDYYNSSYNMINEEEDANLEDENDIKIIEKKATKTSLLSNKNKKTYIKINNPNISINNTTNNTNISVNVYPNANNKNSITEYDTTVEEENFRSIILPLSNYRSNCLEELDIFDTNGKILNNWKLGPGSDDKRINRNNGHSKVTLPTETGYRLYRDKSDDAKQLLIIIFRNRKNYNNKEKTKAFFLIAKKELDLQNKLRDSSFVILFMLSQLPLEEEDLMFSYGQITNAMKNEKERELDLSMVKLFIYYKTKQLNCSSKCIFI